MLNNMLLIYGVTASSAYVVVELAVGRNNN